MQAKCIFNFRQEKIMRLTRYTDYSLRVLMYVGARGDQVSTIAEIARAYDISRDHLMKVVQQLGRDGYLRNVGDVVRRTEPDFDLVECGSCVIEPVCKLTGVMAEALDAFMAVLDRYTLEDLLTGRGDLMQLFGLSPQEDAHHG
jgi:Rrf2 family transcriptional regulator, nitric oxide-sensitive transcriptional repressor